MSSKKKNFYEEKEKKKSLMGITSTEAKKGGKLKMAHLILGGIGGGLTGVVTGRSSLLLGLAVTGAGAYLHMPTAAMFGVGLMASGGYQSIAGGVNGIEKDGMDGLKERFVNFTGNLKHQLFLDKLIPKKKKSSDDTTNGVQYFKHSDNTKGGLDFTEANRIEQQISDSARRFESQQVGEVGGLEGIEDKLY